MREKISYIFKRKRNRQLMSLVDFFGYKLFRSRKYAGGFKKILIIQTAHIGDVLFTTPMLSSIRHSFFEAQIDYLCGDWSKEIIQNNPYINNIIIYNAFWSDRKQRFQLGLRKIALLRNVKYDLIIQCAFNYKANILARMIGAKQIVGYDVYGFGFLCDKCSSGFTPNAHDRDSHLKLLKNLEIITDSNQMEVYFSKKDEERGLFLLNQFNLSQTDFAAIGIGCGDVNRLWLPKHWAELLTMLIQKFPKIIVLGSKNESIIFEDIKNELIKIGRKDVIDDLVCLFGSTTLMDAAFIIRHAKIFIGLESSLVHIANALGTKSVAIFSGFTETGRWAINDKCTITLKSSCDSKENCDPNKCVSHSCLFDIKPEFVFDNVLSRLDNK